MKYNKNILFLILTCTLYVMPIRAEHLIGGGFSYNCLGNNKYQISLNIYRDGLASTTPFDSEAYIVVYHAVSGNIYSSQNVALDSSLAIAVNTIDTCAISPSPIRYYVGRYELVLDLPDNGEGYNIVHVRCCRVGGLTNLTQSGSQGSSYVMNITSDALKLCNDESDNSGPVFESFPPLLSCVNTPIDFSHAATDMEDDSLVYQFLSPLSGGSNNCPIFGINPMPPACPFDPPPPPYDPVSYQSGFSSDNPLGADLFNLNSRTGRITGVPNSLGKYVMSIGIEEYRSGKLLSTTFRDFQLRIIDCSAFDCQVTSSRENFISDILVFPNPVKTKLFLRILRSTKIDKINKLEIYNVFGWLVYMSDYSSIEHDISFLESGHYFLLLKGAEKTYVAEFVKVE